MFYWQQHYDPRNYYNHVTQTPYYPGCSLSCSQKQSFATQPQLQHPNYDHETFFGYIKHPTDALLVIEACIKGHLRPFDKPPTEMASLPIRSGTVMVLTDSSNGVKRWRDGVKWSPSRAYGPFLVYRQIEPQLNSNNKYQPSQSFNPQQHQQHISKDTIKEGDKVPTSVKLKSKVQLVKNGLTKRTISLIGSDNVRHRVIAYYRQDDVVMMNMERQQKGTRMTGSGGYRKGLLKIPTEDERLTRFIPVETDGFKNLLARSLPQDLLDWAEHSDVQLPNFGCLGADTPAVQAAAAAAAKGAKMEDSIRSLQPPAAKRVKLDNSFSPPSYLFENVALAPITQSSKKKALLENLPSLNEVVYLEGHQSGAKGSNWNQHDLPPQKHQSLVIGTNSQYYLPSDCFSPSATAPAESYNSWSWQPTISHYYPLPNRHPHTSHYA